MDTSTIIFIATLGVGFIFLRWFISDAAPTTKRTSHPANESVPRQPRQQRPAARAPRQVTTGMIEVVQAIAPDLSAEQIRYDLQRSGSVEATIDRFLAEGTLPFPPGYQPPTSTDERNNNKIAAENLLEKYGVTDLDSDDIDEKDLSLAERKKLMVLRARKRMEAQLRNDQDLSKLVK